MLKEYKEHKGRCEQPYKEKKGSEKTQEKHANNTKEGVKIHANKSRHSENYFHTTNTPHKSESPQQSVVYSR